MPKAENLKDQIFVFLVKVRNNSYIQCFLKISLYVPK